MKRLRRSEARNGAGKLGWVQVVEDLDAVGSSLALTLETLGYPKAYRQGHTWSVFHFCQGPLAATMEGG